MPSQEDIAFAKIAIQNKLLSQEQAATCLRMVDRFAADGKTVPVSEVFLNQKLLKREQADAVATVVQYTLTRMRDNTHARLLVEKGLVTQDKIDGALDTQQQFFKQNRQTRSILDFLVDQGLLKRDKAADVLHEAEKHVSSHVAAAASKATAPGVAKKTDARMERAGKCTVAIKTVSLPTGRKVSCVALAGQLDTEGLPGVQKIVREILSQEGDEGKFLVVNLESLGYMSSAGIGLIAGATKEAEKKGGAFELANVPKKLQDVMTLVGWGEGRKFHTMEQALGAMARA